MLPLGYLAALKRHCAQRDMLLIVDEAQTGIGRSGDISAAAHHEGVVPDILTLSKTLGNSLALSAVVTRSEIDTVCAESGYYFYTTHANDPLPAAVGAKALEIVVRDGLVENARAMGAVLLEGLRKLRSRYGCVGDVRGRGLMLGVEIVVDRGTKEPGVELGRRLSERAYELGVWANLVSHSLFGVTLRIAPPITITREEIDRGVL